MKTRKTPRAQRRFGSELDVTAPCPYHIWDGEADQEREYRAACLWRVRLAPDERQTCQGVWSDLNHDKAIWLHTVLGYVAIIHGSSDGRLQHAPCRLSGFGQPERAAAVVCCHGKAVAECSPFGDLVPKALRIKDCVGVRVTKTHLYVHLWEGDQS